MTSTNPKMSKSAGDQTDHSKYPRANPQSRLPVRDGLVDWDCPEAISVPDMERSLAHIRSTGSLPVSHNFRLSRRSSHGFSVPSLPLAASSSSSPSPGPNPSAVPSLTHATSQPDLESKEDRNSVGKCPVSDAKIEAMKAKVRAWVEPGQPGHVIFAKPEPRLCILDGFLLYCPQMRTVMDLIDIKLFLLVSRAKATQRREARDGYVTLEGFWKDPPGYVDKIVWPNYVQAHKWLFEDGNVEGVLRQDVLAEKGIHAQLGKGLDVDMEETLEWAVDTIMQALEKVVS